MSCLVHGVVYWLLLCSLPTRRSSDLFSRWISSMKRTSPALRLVRMETRSPARSIAGPEVTRKLTDISVAMMEASVVLPSPRSEEHTSELQSPCNLVCRLLLEKKDSLY